jgi:hypothetical protein
MKVIDIKAHFLLTLSSIYLLRATPPQIHQFCRMTHQGGEAQMLMSAFVKLTKVEPVFRI